MAPKSNPLARAALLLAVASAAFAQDPAAPPAETGNPYSKGGGPPPDSPAGIPRGTAQASMWPAPTAEDWKKPVLITFQRTWEDALTVAKETGKPILACVNMDGEVASEHYAGVRYRSAEIAPMYAPYVCVAASVYRHTPRDHDEQGRRVLCPRFGSVTCGEHIAIEPFLIERYFDGKRIAPRHVMIELDEKETFDVYFANDTASIFRTIQDGIAKRAASPKPPVVRGDRPVTERVASRDVQDRVAVEAAYAAGDAEKRRALLEAAAAQREAPPVDLLRLAVFGLDAELGALARKSLAQTDSPAATDVIVEALKVPMAEAERQSLIAALERIGKTSKRAEWLAALHQGLGTKSAAVDVEGWDKTIAKDDGAPAVADWYALENDRRAQEEARRAKPDDPVATLELAETSLALAVESRKTVSSNPKLARAFEKSMLDDAREAAVLAEELKAPQWRVDTVVALSAYYKGDVDLAYKHAEAAVKAMPSGEPGRNAMSVLVVFAESRFKAIQQAVRERRRWPSQWLADVNAAYSVLLKHPLGTDAQVVWHYDFLTWLGANDPAGKVLDGGLARFPASPDMHRLLRERVLKETGIEGLEAAYEKRLAAPDVPPSVVRFAGYASLATAEFFRRAGNFPRSLDAYARAVAHYEKAAAADPAMRDRADHYVALVHAGRARIAMERGEHERAVEEILASYARRAESAGTEDGLGITPAMTGDTLSSMLTNAKKDDLAAKVKDALGKLDPWLLPKKNE